MPKDWITFALLAFGIAVGIVGVIAYLRMYRGEKNTETQSSKDASDTDTEADAEQKRTQG